jgi:hypothetical protein
MRAGDEFGGWRLIERLGEGGNAVVWEAERGGERGAIKLLTRRSAEAVARFAREIETMRELAGRTGVLPLLDAEMPDRSRRPVAGWLVTPVAEVSYEALKGSELREVVEAIQEVAATLAELHAEPGKAHRDLKPSNLFRSQGRWALGDFGLVTGDDSEALTAPGRILGPINFVAYEVMIDPTTADPFRADVCSLAKTLWVLATEQRWPPPGHQLADEFPIRQYRQHPRSDLLDSLIERATSLRPEDRPTMAEFAEELRSWVGMSDDKSEGFSLGDYGAELRERAAPYFDAQRQERALGEATYAAYEALRGRLEPMIQEMERNLPGFEGNPNHGFVIKMLQRLPGIGQPRIVTSYVESVRVSQPGQGFAVALRMGAMLERLDDGVVRLNALLFVGREGELGGDFWVAEERQARAGSIDVLAQIEALGQELEEYLPEYVRRYEEQAY